VEGRETRLGGVHGVNAAVFRATGVFTTLCRGLKQSAPFMKADENER
jgi:hypothetical protein